MSRIKMHIMSGVAQRVLSVFFCFVTMASAGCNNVNRSNRNLNAPVKTVRIILPNEASAVLHHISSVFAKRVEDRSSAKVVTGGNAELSIACVIDPSIGKEGFRIEDGEKGVIRIVGNDDRGVLYGMGKLLRTSSYLAAGFKASEWRGTSVPEKPVRGMYFATHFFNYYQNAPIEEIRTYVQDLALWGVNSLITTFDMHQFNGFEDLRAVEMLGRLKSYLQAAKDLGLAVGFIVIGNEGYGNSPIELRAEPGGSRGGNFPEVVCPIKPGGTEYINHVMSDYFDWASDLQPEYICVWGYDQGGCGCDYCKPWGTNGFIKAVKEIQEIASQKLPGAKTILSTWYFDKTEWEDLGDLLVDDPTLADLLMVESEEFENGELPSITTHLPLVGFPEISMYQTFPWGGFGATPLTKRLYQQWEKLHERLDGGFPYSEGIYEDISKVAYTQLYWNPKATLDEILSEYIAYEYGLDSVGVEEVLNVIDILESNHHMRWWPGKLAGVKLSLDWFPSYGLEPQPDPLAEEAYASVKEVDQRMPVWAQESWRWRILYIRAMLDAELKANGGAPNEKCNEGFQELMEIYHVSEDTDPAVKPPITVSSR